MVLGSPAKKKPVQLFHSREDAEHAPNISFSMEGFFRRRHNRIVRAPGQRKTLILLNVASLLTGDALFAKFKVLEQRI